MNNSATSAPTTDHPKPSFWLPTLVSGILGVMIAGILYGGRVAMVSVFVLLPMLFLVSGIYAMVIMPRIARVRYSSQLLLSRKAMRFQVRGALLGILFACILVVVLSVIVFPFVAPRENTPASGQGESLLEVVVGGLVGGLTAFVVARFSQLRGIEQWRSFGSGK